MNLLQDIAEPVERELRLLERQIWKKTMLATPDHGKIWSTYLKVGDTLMEQHYFQDALVCGYNPALAVVEQHMSGQHALRKRLGTLMKMAQCEWRYEQEPK
jgi:hypothetical protein